MTYMERFDPFEDRSEYRDYRGNWKARGKIHLRRFLINDVPHWQAVGAVGQQAYSAYNYIDPDPKLAWDGMGWRGGRGSRSLGKWP